MKNESADKLIKQKIESLHALSGGIVFGKEEAWNKLQARLEAKPSRKIPVFYWRAAAAMVLFVVGSFFLINYQPHESALNEPAQTKQDTKAPVDVPPVQPVMSSATQATVKQSATIPRRRPATVAVTDTPIAEKQPVNIIRPPAAQNSDTAAILSAGPRVPDKKPLKVVSIYDVLNRTEHVNDTNSFAGNASPPVDFSRMKVVHIKEIEREVNEIRNMGKENGFTQHYPLFRRPDNEDIPAVEEYHQPRTFLKNMLNTQN